MVCLSYRERYYSLPRSLSLFSLTLMQKSRLVFTEDVENSSLDLRHGKKLSRREAQADRSSRSHGHDRALRTGSCIYLLAPLRAENVSWRKKQRATVLRQERASEKAAPTGTPGCSPSTTKLGKKRGIHPGSCASAAVWTKGSGEKSMHLICWR